LSRHMAQGTNGAGCFRRELKNGRHAACESGWDELRREHGKKRVWSFQVERLLVNGFVRSKKSMHFTNGIERDK